MRSVFLRSLLVVGIGGLVLAGVLYVASTVDARPPQVLAISLTQPLPDEPGVGLPTTSLEVAFSELIDTESATDAVRVDPAVEGSLNWSGSVLIFTPRQALDLATTYIVSVEPGLRDLAGNEMTELPDPFTFETTGLPRVVETEPADGASGVALDAPITIRFSGLMDTASVEAALRLRPIFPHTLRWSGQELRVEPTESLAPEAAYRVEIGGEAFDVSGIALADPVSISFRTLTSGLDVATVIPAHATDGIARTTPIAVVFDEPIDPATVSPESLEITPEVSGTLEVLDRRGDAPASDDDGVVLAFSPSGPLPANTTFEVRLGGSVAALDGGGLFRSLSWTFTTGAPPTALTNQVAFISDRSGIANLWTMNVDGSAPHQRSAELTPILDYAVAPDGSSFVIGDGRRLVFLNADGSGRRVLTDDEHLEFDAVYAPDGQRIAFARADAEDGSGLGIWERAIPGGETSPLTLPAAWVTDDDKVALRAPRYAPSGGAIAFVDLRGWVAIIGAEDEPSSRARFDATRPPIWLPDASALVLTGRSASASGEPRPFEAPVAPLATGTTSSIHLLERSAAAAPASGLGAGTEALAVGPDGEIAYLAADGTLRVATEADTPGVLLGVGETGVLGASFAPGEPSIAVVVRRGTRDHPLDGAIVRIGRDGTGRDVLSNDGRQPRWLP